MPNDTHSQHAALSGVQIEGSTFQGLLFDAKTSGGFQWFQGARGAGGGRREVCRVKICSNTRQRTTQVQTSPARGPGGGQGWIGWLRLSPVLSLDGAG